MSAYRQGNKVESDKPRSTRFEYREGEWYLQTREGIELGPYESHAEASVSLNDYLDFVGSGNTKALEELCKRKAA
ncbi:MAG: hypothetical protein HRU20_12835 [Pseudomonadales bacterium]|nr:hypothetical protein [Pseudomonadales bacterium]